MTNKDYYLVWIETIEFKNNLTVKLNTTLVQCIFGVPFPHLIFIINLHSALDI